MGTQHHIYIQLLCNDEVVHLVQIDFVHGRLCSAGLQIHHVQESVGRLNAAPRRDTRDDIYQLKPTNRPKQKAFGWISLQRYSLDL